MVPIISFEVGSIILLFGLICVNVVGWIRTNAKASQKAESGDKLLSTLNKKVDTLKIDYTDSSARVEENLKALEFSIHNGISKRLDKVIETQGSQWKAINENSKNIGILKDRTD